MIREHKNVLIILGIILCVKLFFAALPPFKTDMDSFIAWGEQVYSVGSTKFYTSDIWTDYAPGYIYFLWVIAFIKHIFFPLATREMYEFLHKIVPIICDVATGFVIYLIVKRFRDMLKDVHSVPTYIPAVTSAVYLLSPFTTLDGAIWGQSDPVFTLFLAISFYYLIRFEYLRSVVFFVVAGVIKPQAVVLLPLYAIVLLKTKNSGIILKSFGTALVTFFALVFPFFGLNSIGGIVSLLNSSVNVYPYSSINTFNFWGMYGFWKDDRIVYAFNLSAQQFGYVLWGLCLVIGVILGIKYLSLKDHVSFAKNSALFAAYFIFTAVMFLSRMHERYLYPLFIYLVIFCGMYLILYLKNNTLTAWKSFFTGLAPFIFYGLVSLLHTINLYYVYVYYQYFNVGVPLANTLYYLIEKNLILWSQLMFTLLVIFIFSLTYYLPYTGEHKR